MYIYIHIDYLTYFNNIQQLYVFVKVLDVPFITAFCDDLKLRSCESFTEAAREGGLRTLWHPGTSAVAKMSSKHGGSRVWCPVDGSEIRRGLTSWYGILISHWLKTTGFYSFRVVVWEFWTINSIVGESLESHADPESSDFGKDKWHRI